MVFEECSNGCICSIYVTQTLVMLQPCQSHFERTESPPTEHKHEPEQLQMSLRVFLTARGRYSVTQYQFFILLHLSLSLSLRRVLLIAIAILSLYSVHLLLVTAKEGGWYLLFRPLNIFKCYDVKCYDCWLRDYKCMFPQMITFYIQYLIGRLL